MSGQGYKRHIPQGNSPEEMRVSHTRIWDAIDSIRKESQSTASAIAIQAQTSQAPTAQSPQPPPPVSQVGLFGDIFLLMGG